MNACLQHNAWGIGGADPVEYNGPTVDDLIEQKMRDPNFFQGATTYLAADVYQACADGDALTFLARFRYEARQWAEREAEQEYEAARDEFYRSAA